MHLTIGNRVYSSWSLRPWILMRVKDIPFQDTVVPLRQPDSAERLRAASPTSKVPCLVDGDVTVWETLAIMEYLAEKYPAKGIWPHDGRARAHARASASEMHGGFPLLRKHYPMTVTQRFKAKPVVPEAQPDIERIVAVWHEARAVFGVRGEGPFLYGVFTAADAMYVPVATRFRTYGIPLDPVAQGYVNAVLALPAYQEWLRAATAEPWMIEQNGLETVIEDLRAKA